MNCKRIKNNTEISTRHTMRSLHDIYSLCRYYLHNMYKEIEGDLIQLALKGSFDVIAQGCNCFCRQKRGLAPQMVAAFQTDQYPLEQAIHTGQINKLGQIDIGWEHYAGGKKFWVINCYSQYQWSTETKPFDYEAFTLCMRKINHLFRGKHIGLPQIGSHLAGGDWEVIRNIILRELHDSEVTVVIYKPE